MSNFHNEARSAYDARRNAIEALRSKVIEVGTDEVSEADAEFITRSNAEIDRLDAVVDGALKSAATEARSLELEALIGSAPVPEAAKAPTGMDEVRGLMGLAVGEKRDLVTDTAGDGAELVPTTLFGQLYQGLTADGASMFSLGRNETTSGGEDIDYPIMSTLSTATLVAEAAAISESDPQFTTVTVPTYKYGLAIQVSSELEDDNAVANAMSSIVAQAIEGIKNGVGAHLLTGTGSGQPDGVDNGSNVVTATGVATPTAANLMAAYHDITSGYRANAKWVFNDATVLGIRQLTNAGTIDFVWQPGLQAGAPDLLLGKPVVTDSNVAVAGANAKLGIFGDFKRGYLVRTVGSIRAERSTDFAFLNDLTTFRFIGRFGGEIIDNAAYTVITNEAS
jgi:HK97 family phage major capsid protein